jgi:hypothetical protein
MASSSSRPRRARREIGESRPPGRDRPNHLLPLPGDFRRTSSSQKARTESIRLHQRPRSSRRPLPLRLPSSRRPASEAVPRPSSRLPPKSLARTRRLSTLPPLLRPTPPPRLPRTHPPSPTRPRTAPPLPKNLSTMVEISLSFLPPPARPTLSPVQLPIDPSFLHPTRTTRASIVRSSPQPRTTKEATRASPPVVSSTTKTPQSPCLRLSRSDRRSSGRDLSELEDHEERGRGTAAGRRLRQRSVDHLATSGACLSFSLVFSLALFDPADADLGRTPLLSSSRSRGSESKVDRLREQAELCASSCSCTYLSPIL